MQKYIKPSAFLITLTAIIIFTSLLAVPYIYSDNQIKNYLEQNIIVPGKKIVINSDISYGVFPSFHLEIEDADLVDKFGKKSKVTGFTASTGFFNVFTGNMPIKYFFNLSGNDYKGKLTIDNYNAIQKRLPSKFRLRLDVPFVIELTGTFQLKENEVSLRDYNLYHKSTKISGDIILTRLSDTEFNLVNHISVVTENLDDIRRLYNIDVINDPTDILSGSGRMNFTLSAKGDNLFSLKRNLAGQGSIRLKDAVLNGYDLEEFAKNPFNVKYLPNGERAINIESLSGVFTILNGVFSTNDFAIKSKKANLVASGSYDIADEKVDMAINLNADLTDAKINLPLIIRGDIKAPRVIGNYAQARTETGEAVSASESAEIKENVDNLANFINQKISENATEQGITPKQNDTTIFEEILPWRNAPAVGGQQPNAQPKKVLSSQEEDSVVGNWDSGRPNPTSYEQQQLQRSQQLNKPQINEQNLNTLQNPDANTGGVQPINSGAAPLQPTTTGTGIYTTEPMPVDEGTAEDPDSVVEEPQ